MHSRFTVLEDFGEEDLERLDNSTVAVVGLGATGSVIAEHLARHGVNLIVIDRDYLEENDLYSSNLYTRRDVEEGVPKAVAMKRKLSGITEVDAEAESLGPGNTSLLKGADLIMDGTDNLETRFLIDEYSSRENIPWIYTAAVAKRGYSMLFDSECFSCLFDEIKAGSLETCETAGIMREIAGIAASKSSLTALRYLCGRQTEEKLEVIPEGDSLEVESGGCEVCQGKRFPELESGNPVQEVCGEGKFQLRREVSGKAFERLRESGEVIADNDYLTRVQKEGESFTLFRSGRAIIEARSEGHAEQKFSEIIG